MLTVNTYDVGPVAPVPVPVSGNRGTLTVPACTYWKCVCGCVGERVTALGVCNLGELAVLSEGGGSSLTPDLIICAITGWVCLSLHDPGDCLDESIGASTNALASASACQARWQ